MSLRKKIIATIVGLTMALAVVPLVQGQTVEELQAQIQQLLAQIQQLQAQIAILQGAPTSGTACTFTRDLFLGVTGEDVKCLQQYLNSAGHQLAATGAGSPGNETTYYGPRTKAAVAAWQAANGVSPAAGYFGPISRAKYNSLALVTPPPSEEEPAEEPAPEPSEEITTPGAEGSITAKYAASPVSGQEVYANSTGVAIVGVEVKATGSDVKVDRLDLNFTSRPWLNVAKIHVLDGSTVLKTVEVTSSNTLEVSVGSSYTVRVDGLNVVVPKDTTKTITVQIDPLLVAGETSTTVTYKVLANGVRGTDGKGIQQYAPSSDLDARTFTVKTSEKAELELSAHPDNNEYDHNVIVSTSVTTNDVPLLVMNVKSKTNASVVRYVTVDATGSATSSDWVYKLYDGSTLVKSAASTAAGKVIFDDLSLSIPKDSTKTLHVKVDIPKQSNVAGSASGTVSVALASTTSSGIYAEDATTFSAVNITGSAVSAGKAVLFDKAPSLALASASITPVKPPNTGSNSQWADFKIRVNVTAMGGDIYVASNTSSGVLASTSVPASSSIPAGLSLISDATQQSNGNWLVKSGETKYFEVSGRIENNTALQYYVRAYIENIKWGVAATDATRTTQTWGLDQLETSEVLLEAKN